MPVQESCDELPMPEMMRDTLASDEELDDIDRMLRDAKPECLDARNLKKLEQMRKDAKTPLYQCSNISKLEADMMLLEMKSRNGLSDKGFDDLLNVMRKMLPSPNELPENTYHAKQMICPMGLEVEKIHACPNDCILYRGEKYKDLDACPVCEASRYKDDSAKNMTCDRNKSPPPPARR